MRNLVFSIIIVLCFSGCCLKSISIKPEMSAVDVKNANIGVIKGDIDFVFKDCCPSKEEKQLALSIKKKAETLSDQLLADEITPEEYNMKIEAFHKGLAMVVYACASSTGKNLSSIMDGPAPTLNDAWLNLRKINESIK
jgi:hypothetical protein